MRFITLLWAAIFIMHSAVAGEMIAFDMGGMRIGDKLTEEFVYSHCPAKDKGKAERLCHKSITMEGGDVFVMYYFDDFKLIGVSLSYESSIFGDIVAAYANKFGQLPHEEKEEPVTTKAGVKYVNEVKSWNTDSGVFIIEKYGSYIDKGYAYLRSKEYEKYLLKKKVERQKKLGGEL
ncbi:MAG: hypothetical protein ABL858_04265 [Candidatus Nitrotoga sp.]